MSDPQAPVQQVVVVDRDGNRHAMAPSEATQAYQSGQYGVEGDRVAVRDASGVVGHVPADQLQGFLSANNGSSLVSADEVAQAEFEARNPSNTGRAMSAGFLRGAIPFVGSRVVEALGVSPEEQRRLDRQHDVAAPVAEIGGAIAPLLLSGGGSGAARGAASGAEAAEAASAVGRGAEVAEGTASLLGRGARVAPQLPARTGASLVTAAPAVEAAAPVTDVVAQGAARAHPAAQEALAAFDEANAIRTVELPAASSVGQESLGTARTLSDVRGPVRIGAHNADPEAVTQAFAREAGGAEDLLRQSMGTPAAPGSFTSSLGEFVVSGNTRGTALARIEQAEAAARTAGLEAGIPLLGEEAQLASDAISMGNRDAFARVLRSVVNPIGEAGNAIRGATPTLGRRAAAGAAEGGLFGASNYVQTQHLEDEPLSAEGLVMAIGGGALLGAAGELGIGGLTALGRRGSAAVAERLSPSLRQAMSEGRLAQYMADDLAVRAVQPTQGQRTRLMGRLRRNEAGKLVEGGNLNVQEVGRTLNESGVLEGAPSINAISERLNAVVPQAGRDLRNVVATADSQGPRAIATTLRARNELIAAAESSLLKSERRLAQDIREEFASLPSTMNPTEMHDLRMLLDGKTNWNRAAQTPLDKAYREMRNAISSDLELAMKAASDVPGTYASPATPGLPAAWQGANQRYRSLRWARDAAAGAAARHESMANMPIASLLSGAGAGAVFGGISPKALAVGFVTGAFHRWVKEHAAAIGASGFSAFAKTQSLNRTAQAINASAGKSVRAALRSGPSVRRAALYGTTLVEARRLTPKQYQRTATDLYRLSVDPEASLAAGAALAPVIQSAPSTGTLAQQVQAARLAYLSSLLPSAGQPDAMSALLALRSASPKQMAQFGEALAIAKDPYAFLESFAEGQATPEQVAHMRALWPSTYQTMLNHAEQELARPEPLSPGAVRSVRILMGQQSFAQSPQYIALLQANYATQGTPGASGTAPTNSMAPQVMESSGVAKRELTSQQAAEARIAAGGPGS